MEDISHFFCLGVQWHPEFSLTDHDIKITKKFYRSMQDNKVERIAKVIARRGFCSRREAEQLIFQGDVFVDGVAVQSPSIKVSYDSEIKISGQIIPKKEELKLWAFYKPKNCITSYKDPQGRPTVFQCCLVT